MNELKVICEQELYSAAYSLNERGASLFVELMRVYARYQFCRKHLSKEWNMTEEEVDAAVDEECPVFVYDVEGS